MNAFKKILNVILIMVGIALIAVCADLTVNKLVGVEFESLNETDRGAIEELCQMTLLFDERYGNETIWNDSFNLQKTSAVITRKYGLLKGRTYAVNMSIPKSIFAQRITMPTEYSDIYVYRYSYLFPLTFSLASKNDGEYSDVGGKRVYTSTFDSQTVRYDGTGSLEEEYASSAFNEMVDSIDVPSKDESSHFEVTEENIALMGLRYRLIDDMLTTRDKDELKKLIAEYVLVREYQSEKYPEFANRAEQTEVETGTQLYVFYEISSSIGHNITFFNKSVADSITFYSAYYYLCTGRYNSDVSEFLDESGVAYEGAALCKIIADNDLSANWQSKLNGSPENFTSQYTLLKNYCGGTCSDANDKTLDDIKSTYNYDEIMSMAKTLVGAMEN